MPSSTPDDESAKRAEPRPASDEDPARPDRMTRELSEHIRRVQLETEARILARWKKRGLFGLTTSTG